MAYGTCPICQKKNVGYRCFWLAIQKRIKFLIAHPSSFIGLFTVFFELFKEKGTEGVRNRFMNQCEFYEEQIFYQAWQRNSMDLTQDQIENIQQNISSFNKKPLFSLILFHDSGDFSGWNDFLISLSAQYYPIWEVILIYPGNKTESEIRANLPSQIKKNEGQVRIQPSPDTSLPNTLNTIEGDFISVIQKGYTFHALSLYLAALELNRKPKTLLIYGDHDIAGKGKHQEVPVFKPDWCLDYFYSHPYLGRNLFFHRREFIDFELSNIEKSEYLNVLRLIEEKKDDEIHHIPFILYHSPKTSASKTDLPTLPLLKAHFLKMEIDAEVTQLQPSFHKITYQLPVETPKISILIPTRDNLAFLQRCIDSILEKTAYNEYEIVVIDNGSKEPNLLAYFEELKNVENIQVLSYPHPFNYSAINNFGVKHVTGEVLCFLNDDTEVLSTNWLNELVSHAVRPGVGAVGAKLYYENKTLQHAGVIVGLGGLAGHIMRYVPGDSEAQFKYTHLTRNYSAVTAACLVVLKDRFLEVNGFNEENLKITYNDVDLCLKLSEKGYRNIWTPYAELFHLESISRGHDLDRENLARFMKEAEYFNKTWSKYIEHDPCYNPNLTVEGEDCRLSVESRYKFAE